MSWGRLTTADLRGFDAEARQLATEMMDAGWVARISSNSHIILRAPDGETTYAIARQSWRARGGRNARAYFERWKRCQP